MDYFCSFAGVNDVSYTQAMNRFLYTHISLQVLPGFLLLLLSTACHNPGEMKFPTVSVENKALGTKGEKKERHNQRKKSRKESVHTRNNEGPGNYKMQNNEGALRKPPGRVKDEEQSHTLSVRSDAKPIAEKYTGNTTQNHSFKARKQVFPKTETATQSHQDAANDNNWEKKLEELLNDLHKNKKRDKEKLVKSDKEQLLWLLDKLKKDYKENIIKVITGAKKKQQKQWVKAILFLYKEKPKITEEAINGNTENLQKKLGYSFCFINQGYLSQLKSLYKKVEIKLKSMPEDSSS